jgi:hypothetical protein
VCLRFRTAFVFDVSQTDGKELPQFPTVKGDATQHLEGLKSFARSRGIEVLYDAGIAPAKGVSYGGRVSILPELTSADEVATLAHETECRMRNRDRSGGSSHKCSP